MMKPRFSHWAATLAVALAAWTSPAAHATVIVADNFDAYTAGSSLNDLNGGNGAWTSAWSTTGFQNIVTSGEGNMLQVGTGTKFSGGDNATYRSFEGYSGNTLFASVTLTATAGYDTDDANDFFTFWLDNAASGNHGNVPNTGFDSDGNVVGRISSSYSIDGGPVVQGTTYTLVIEVSKSGANGSNYDTIRFWMNPSYGDLGTPVGTVTHDINRSELSMLGLRIINNEQDNVYQVDNIVVGTEWADVVAVPEPSPLAFVSVGTMLLVGATGMRMRKAD